MGWGDVIALVGVTLTLVVPIVAAVVKGFGQLSERLVKIEAQMTSAGTEMIEFKSDIRATTKDHEIRIRTLERGGGMTK